LGFIREVLKSASATKHFYVVFTGGEESILNSGVISTPQLIKVKKASVCHRRELLYINKKTSTIGRRFNPVTRKIL
jgi:hypothetical protein